MRRTVLTLLLGAAACVPPDESVPYGSASFQLGASRATTFGFTTVDGFTARVDQVLIGFDSMTIGEFGVPERCSYRGRGARKNVVFDPRFGLVQTFNGVEGGPCPDVGVVLAAPVATTELGPGATLPDLLTMRERQLHAVVRMTFQQASLERYLRLDFDARTASRFGGCQVQSSTGLARGVVIVAETRATASVAFALETLFRDAASRSAALRYAPFVAADRDGDGVTTMEELDDYPLSSARTYSSLYEQADGSTRGTFGDFVRAQFRFAFTYRDEGQCTGNEPVPP